MGRPLSKKIQKVTCLMSTILSLGTFSPKSRALGTFSPKPPKLGSGAIMGIGVGSGLGITGISFGIYQLGTWLISFTKYDQGYKICNALYKELLSYVEFLDKTCELEEKERKNRPELVNEQLTNFTLEILSDNNKQILQNSKRYGKTSTQISKLSETLAASGKNVGDQNCEQILQNVITTLGNFLKINEKFLKNQEGRTKLSQIENYDLEKLKSGF